MNTLVIELKNGRLLDLTVSPIFLEYVQDYEGGIEQLQRDAGTAYALNQLLYAIIASNYDEPLTYKQAVGLVKIEDIERIVEFINQELPNVTENTTTITDKRKHRV